MTRRIVLAIIATVLLVLLAVGCGTFGFARVATKRTELRELESTAQRISALIPPGVAVDDQSITQANETREQLASVLKLSGVSQVIVTSSGRTVGEWPDYFAPSEDQLERLRSGSAISGARGTTLWAASARLGPRNNLFVVMVNATRQPVFGTTGAWFLGSAAVAFVCSIALAIALSRRLARPVTAAAETARHLASGELTVRMRPEPGTDELAVLANSINALGSELERARGLERQFLMSITHDLRTPMTSIRGYAEAIADNVAADPGAAAAVILAESKRLDRLIGDILDLAKLEAHQFSFQLIPVDLHAEAAAIVKRFAPAAQQLAIELTSEVGPETSAYADPDRVQQVLGNLVANALRFATSRVTLGGHGSSGIYVEDDGIGIDPLDIGHVFERLYQARHQPTASEATSGLGLAIVKELVEQMNGTITVESRPGTTRFLLTLPTGPAEPVVPPATA